MSANREIVVGVDGTSSSERALAWAYAEANRRRVPLRVVTAWLWEPAEMIPLGADSTVDLERVARDVQNAALSALSALPVPGETAGREVPLIRDVVRGTPAEALITASAVAEMVVVGTHGRGPVRQFLMGSVSQAVIRHAHCPVVVMPPDMASIEPEG